MRSDTYKTKQKQMILQCLQNNCHTSVTALAIEESLRNQGEVVGKSTIYRYLDKLIESGFVMKFFDDEKKMSTFQYIDKSNKCDEHMHLKCIKCGILLHLDCEHMVSVNSHIRQEHNFKIDNAKTVILGICDKCSKE